MSVLVRFNVGDTKYKARLFESGSKKMECSWCGERKFGTLIRLIEPKKIEGLVCHECLVHMAIGVEPDPIADIVTAVPVYPIESAEQEAPKTLIAKAPKVTKKRKGTRGRKKA